MPVVHTVTQVRVKALFLILLVMWSAFIFIRSSKTSDESSGESGTIIRMIAGVVNTDFGKMTADEQTGYIQNFQFIARKTAHFASYTMLGIFAAATAASFSIYPLAGYVYCSTFAASDEIHQYFVPGRSCELRDFLIDCAGALVGLLLAVAAVLIIRTLRKKKIK